MSNSGNNKIRARTLAREAVFKAIFSKRYEGVEVLKSLDKQLGVSESEKIGEYGALLFQVCHEHQEHILQVVEHFMQQPRHVILTDVDFSVLVLATAELLYCRQTPAKVVINEAVDMAKKYGSQGGYKVVNALLDNINKKGGSLLK